MAREYQLLGVTVGQGTTIYWGTIASIVIGAPIYAWARGWIETIALWFNGAQHFVSDLFGWYAVASTVGIEQIVRGFQNSATAFAISIGQFGLIAFPIAIVVGAITTTIILLGVTYVVQRL